MARIFKGRVYNAAPYPSVEINYEYTRDGANMKYHFWGKVYLESTTGWYSNNIRLKLYLNGSNVYTKDCKSSSKGWSINFDSGWYTVSNKTSGTTPFYFTAKDTQNSNWCNYTSRVYQLDVAPAYFSSTPKLELINETETSATFKWTTPETAARVQYKIGNGSWVDVVQDANAKSGTFTVSGLNHNTSYTIYGDFTRRDSGLWAQTKPSVDIKTYNIPYCSVTPDFTLGDNVTLNFYNPLGRELTFSIIGPDGSETTDSAWSITGTSYTGISSSVNTEKLYKSIPNVKWGYYRVKTVWGSYSSITPADTSKFYVNESTNAPTFDESNIINVVDTLHVNDITGLATKIIKGHNKVKGTIKPMTTKNYATGKRYIVNANASPSSQEISYSSSNKEFTFDNITANSFSITAYDSREISTTKNKSIDLIDYSIPKVNNFTMTRQNGLGKYAILAADGTNTYWSGWSQIKKYNTIKKVYFRYKPTGGNYSNWIDITSALTKNTNGAWTVNATLDVVFDTTKKYDFQLYVQDLLESSSIASNSLSTANGFLWRDLKNKRLGINKKPDEALDVSGNVKCNYLYGKLTPQYFQDAIYGTAGSVNLYDRTYLDCINANRSAFFPGENVYIEHSTDGGSSWTEYTTSQFSVSSRKNLFSMTRAHALHFGTVKPVTTNHRCRVTMQSPGSTWYCSLDRAFMFINTGGHTIKCDIEVSTYGAQTTYTKIISDYPLNGWSGPNMISFGNRSAWGTNSTGHVYNIRITFKITAVNTTFQNTLSSVNDIRFFGPNYWGSAGVPRYAGHLYNWDAEQNATFPATVNASKLRIDGTDVLLKVYPVGSIYISVNNTNPGTLFGGTWEQIKDVFLYATQKSPGATGGSKNHTHSLDTNTAVGAIRLNNGGSLEYAETTVSANITTNYSITGTGGKGDSASRTNHYAMKLYGNTSSSSNMPPYLEVYMWKRTA